MKNYKIPFLIVFLTLTILNTSCTKNDVKNEPNIIEDPTGGILAIINPPNDSLATKYVALIFNQFPDKIDTTKAIDINIYGTFRNDTTKTLVNAGNIIVKNTLTIPNISTGIYEYKYPQSSIAQGKALMGTSIDLQVTGSTYVDGLTRKIYIPKQIWAVGLYFLTSTIPNNISYTLNWTPDPLNMFRKVLIQVSYYKTLSQYHNNRNPNSVQSLTYTVTDNGTYTIPAVDLARFPESSYIGISISRASETQYLTTRSKIEYISVINGFTAPILIKN